MGPCFINEYSRVKKGNVVVYPQCINISRAGYYRNVPPRIDICAWLNSSTVSDYGSPVYRDLFLFIGVPKEGTGSGLLYNEHGKVVILLARDPQVVGFSLDEFQGLFQELLTLLPSTTNFLVKFHPRTNFEMMDYYEKLLSPLEYCRFYNNQDIKKDAISLCLLMYTTAGIPFSVVGIPCLNLMPMKMSRSIQKKADISFYKKNNHITNDYIEHGIYANVSDINDMKKIFSDLEMVRLRQLRAATEIFGSVSQKYLMKYFLGRFLEIIPPNC